MRCGAQNTSKAITADIAVSGKLTLLLSNYLPIYISICPSHCLNGTAHRLGEATTGPVYGGVCTINFTTASDADGGPLHRPACGDENGDEYRAEAKKKEHTTENTPEERAHACTADTT